MLKDGRLAGCHCYPGNCGMLLLWCRKLFFNCSRLAKALPFLLFSKLKLQMKFGPLWGGVLQRWILPVGYSFLNSVL